MNESVDCNCHSGGCECEGRCPRHGDPEVGDLIVPKDETTFVCEVAAVFRDRDGILHRLHVRQIGTSHLRAMDAYRVKVVKRKRTP